MSWECPTCGATRSCWGPEIYHGLGSRRHEAPRDVVLEAGSQGLVNALAALAETIPGPGGSRPMHPIAYFEGSPTKDAECQKRWKELNDYVSLVKTTLEARRADPNSATQGIRDKALSDLASAIKKFAPDIAEALATRWNKASEESQKATEDFLAFLRSRE